VLVHGRDEARTRAVASEVGGTALVRDLLEPDAPGALADEALAVHGRVDILVANAGIGLSAPFTDLISDDIARLVAVNLSAPIQLASALVGPMVQRGRGHLVLVSSIAGRTGVAGEAVYAATKAGIDAFAESLRLELIGSGVGVSVVIPGLVRTGFHAERADAPTRRRPKPLAPEVVAEAVVDAVRRGRPEVWTPRWLRIAPAVRAVAPAPFRRLSARFGEPIRIPPRESGEPQ
jgi:short-subunit dehydrogenase